PGHLISEIPGPEFAHIGEYTPLCPSALIPVSEPLFPVDGKALHIYTAGNHVNTICPVMKRRFLFDQLMFYAMRQHYQSVCIAKKCVLHSLGQTKFQIALSPVCRVNIF